eukprot:ANDGO_05306.mRNA.1 hypothetical protein DICPUDRAFT_79612
MDSEDFEPLFLSAQSLLIEGFKATLNASFFSSGMLFLTPNHLFYQSSSSSGSFALKLRNVVDVQADSRMLMTQGFTIVEELPPTTRGKKGDTKSHFFGPVDNLESCLALLIHLVCYREGGPYDRYRKRTVIASFSVTNTGKKDYFMADDAAEAADEKRRRLFGGFLQDKGPELTESEKLAQSSLRSLERSLRHAEESRQVASETLATLEQQSNQLDRIRESVANTDHNLHVSDKLLKSMSSWVGTFRAYFSKDPVKQSLSKVETSNNFSLIFSQKLVPQEVDRLKTEVDCLVVDEDKHSYRAAHMQKMADGLAILDAERTTQIDTIPFGAVQEILFHSRPLTISIVRVDGRKSPKILSVRVLDIAQWIRNAKNNVEIKIPNLDWTRDFGLTSYATSSADSAGKPTVRTAGADFLEEQSRGTPRSSRAAASSRSGGLRGTPRAGVGRTASESTPSTSRSSAASRDKSFGQIQEEKTDQGLDELSAYLTDLRAHALTMGDTLEYQNRVIDQVSTEMDRTDNHMKESRGRISRIS